MDTSLDRQMPERIILHTMNGPGAMNMMKALRGYDVYYVPFTYLTGHILDGLEHI